VLTVCKQKPCAGLLLEEYLLGNSWIDPQCATSQKLLLESTHLETCQRQTKHSPCGKNFRQLSTRVDLGKNFRLTVE